MAQAATPHDSVFKTFLSCVETARDFIEIHLPPALRSLCDLGTLRLESGSFIEDDLYPYYSDILYSLKTTGGDGFHHPQLARQLYSSPFPLVDITVIPDEEIMQHRSMAALTLIQKHIRQRDIALLLDRLASLLREKHMSGQQIAVLIKYMIQAGDCASDAAKGFRQARDHGNDQPDAGRVAAPLPLKIPHPSFMPGGEKLARNNQMDTEARK